MLTRRDFLKKCRDISILLCGSPVIMNDVAHGFLRLSREKRPQVAFIQAQSCTACSTSLMYGNETDFVDFITRMIRLQVHPNVSFAQGESYLAQLDTLAEKGGYVLVVEGSIPSLIKEACIFGDKPMYDVLKKYIQGATAVIASGTCSCYGGIPASQDNETGALSVHEYMKAMGISKPVINIPGCPVHPDRFMGTVAYIVATGKIPPLKDGKPAQYFSTLIHDNCPRFQYFSQDVYLEDFEKEKHECLLKKGCRGTITYSDCSSRRWNGGLSVCVESNAPCVGCINENWPFKTDLYLEAKNVEDVPWSGMKKRLKGGAQ